MNLKSIGSALLLFASWCVSIVSGLLGAVGFFGMPAISILFFPVAIIFFPPLAKFLREKYSQIPVWKMQSVVTLASFVVALVAFIVNPPQVENFAKEQLPGPSTVSLQKETPESNVKSSGSVLSVKDTQVVTSNAPLLSKTDARFTALVPSYSRSSNWKTCVSGKINNLDNVHLLAFYDWTQGLSPRSSQQTIIASIAQKLGCPQPTFRTIPAQTEIIKSWNGAGSQSLGAVTFDNSIPKAEWFFRLEWSNSPLNENFGKGTGLDGEQIQLRMASWEYGVVDYDENATIVGTPYIIGFNTASGNTQESGETLLGGNIVLPNHFDYLRVKAPSQAKWKATIERIIAPAQVVAE